jgi:hypothetical protein
VFTPTGELVVPSDHARVNHDAVANLPSHDPLTESGNYTRYVGPANVRHLELQSRPTAAYPHIQMIEGTRFT